MRGIKKAPSNSAWKSNSKTPSDRVFSNCTFIIHMPFLCVPQ
ncbi:mCG147880 [Mus musculus]|nr:mCG147880 [Mus musculus]